MATDINCTDNLCTSISMALLVDQGVEVLAFIGWVRLMCSNLSVKKGRISG